MTTMGNGSIAEANAHPLVRASLPLPSVDDDVPHSMTGMRARSMSTTTRRNEMTLLCRSTTTPSIRPCRAAAKAQMTSMTSMTSKDRRQHASPARSGFANWCRVLVVAAAAVHCEEATGQRRRR
jgi:hypothetical protein